MRAPQTALRGFVYHASKVTRGLTWSQSSHLTSSRLSHRVPHFSWQWAHVCFCYTEVLQGRSKTKERKVSPQNLPHRMRFYKSVQDQGCFWVEDTPLLVQLCLVLSAGGGTGPSHRLASTLFWAALQGLSVCETSSSQITLTCTLAVLLGFRSKASLYLSFFFTDHECFHNDLSLICFSSVYEFSLCLQQVKGNFLSFRLTPYLFLNKPF